MTEHGDDRVDRFLDDLGSATPPSGFAGSMMQRLDGERQPRRSPVFAWLAAAVVVGVLLVAGVFAFVGAGPGPSPSPQPVPSPSTPPSQAATPVPTATPAPTPSPTASPSPSEPAFYNSWQVAVGKDLVGGGLLLNVVDEVGAIDDVVETAAGRTEPPADPYSLAFRQGRDARSLVVEWTAGPCDHRARLTLAPDGRTFLLEFAPRPGCDSMGFGQAVEIRFAAAVSPADFSGSWTTMLVKASDVSPMAMAWFGDQVGFVGGTTGADAVVLATENGGKSWTATGLGPGEVTTLALVPGTGPVTWAGLGCPEGGEFCAPGLYRGEVGQFDRVIAETPVSLSFTPPDGFGAALFEAPTRELRLTEDGGFTWKTVDVPCHAPAPVPLSVTVVDPRTVVVLCEADAAPDAAGPRQIWRSTDRGASWARSATPAGGWGASVELNADGTGWLWAAGAPLLATTDGGATWAPLNVVDGETRQVLLADSLGGGAGMLLVWDEGRGKSLLLWTPDGVEWQERYAFPVTCCG